MLQGIGNDFYTLIACDKLKKGSLKCSLCGLCNEVCPINLDIKSYFKELKLEGRKPIMVRYAEKIHQRRLAKAYD
jgi:L-lactate utilization protein LutB